MIFNIFVFFVAISLSSVSAFYSVIGLTAIFSGSFWPIIIMGSTLELAKLTAASWLYRNWKITPIILKTYFIISILLLMSITSLGIFGGLSKAHIDSTLDYGANSIEVRSLTQQEKMIQNRLDYLLARAKDPAIASDKLDRQIQTTQKELNDISKKKLPLLKEENKLTVDVGPIKYVAQLIYGDVDDGIDKAVRLVIMLIMVVFDPLAVLLLISANISLRQHENESEKISNIKKNLINNDDIVTNSKIDEPIVLEKSESVQINKNDIATMPEGDLPKEIKKRIISHGPGIYSEEIITLDDLMKK